MQKSQTTSFVTWRPAAQFPNNQSEHVEQLACEVSRYFRRPAQEMQDSLEAAWRSRAKRHSSTASVCDHLSDGVARAFFELRQENERLVFCYGDLSRIEGEAAQPLPNSWLLGLELPDQSNRRAIVIECGREPKILWESQSPLKIDPNARTLSG